MEHISISYRDEVIWGTSLGMATESDVEKCYNFIKDFIQNNTGTYNFCSQSDIVRNKYKCGNSIRSNPFCDKEKSISKDDLLNEIQNMIMNREIDVDGGNILSSLKKYKYIDVSSCDRVFFVK